MRDLIGYDTHMIGNHRYYESIVINSLDYCIPACYLRIERDPHFFVTICHGRERSPSASASLSPIVRT